MKRGIAPLILAVPWVLAGCAGTPGSHPVSREEPFAERVFLPGPQDPWAGNAICYGPHRDGQRPGTTSPSAAEIREDLHLMAQRWNLLRVYGSSEFAEILLSVIREDGLNMKVMLGVWIAVEERRDDGGIVVERFAEAALANRREADAAVRLAGDYPGIVVAVSVGSETQVSWSAHRSPLGILIDHVRRVRANVTVPITVADDFNFWNKPESRTLAAEIDFITMHAHPLWNGIQLDDALSWLRRQTEEVRAVHADRLIVVGETGWATSVHDEGEQARLIKGRPGEAEQKRFHDAVRSWSEAERVTVFFFEAFDESWKGGEHPAEVEKHWGLFRADRSRKLAVSRSSSGRAVNVVPE